MKNTRILSILILLLFNTLIYSQTTFSSETNGELKYGLKDESGEIIKDAIYNKIDEFKYGFAPVVLNNQYGLINSEGLEIITPQYQNITINDDYTLLFNIIFINIKQDGKWGVANINGQVLISPKYASEFNYVPNCNYTIVDLAEIGNNDSNINKLYGLINNTNMLEILVPQYKSLEDKGYDYFKISRGNNKYGLYDAQNKIEIFEPKFDNIFAISREIISIEQNGNWVIVDTKGKKLSDNTYDNIFRMFENRAKVYRNKKYGFIDENCNEIIPCIFDEADTFIDFEKDKKVLVKQNGVEFYIDKQGKKVK